VADGHGHHHHQHDSGPLPPLAPAVQRLLAGLLIPLVLFTLVGLVVWWPDRANDGDPNLASPGARAGQLLSATVLKQDLSPCDELGQASDDECITVTVKMHEGPDKGQEVTYIRSFGGGQPDVDQGDNIIVERIEPATGDPFYAFIDFQRTRPLLLLGFMFVALAALIGRVRGVRALVALVLSLIVLIVFTLPSIVDGNSPLAVALVSASLIMFVALYLSHGFNRRTTSAVIGTLISLLVTGLLASIFTAAARLSGLTDDNTSYLRASMDGVDLRGILLAGTIIGALGVLDDVTVTQASAVWEIHQANPRQSVRQLYASALRIGQDHISSVINTLLLAYVGAALPLLLLFSQTGERWTTIASGELVATEIVRTLVGSIGLMCSVPVTTFLTAFVVAGRAGLASPEDADAQSSRPPRASRPSRRRPSSDPFRNDRLDSSADLFDGDRW
jgi:uncharacterized membrane protein